MAKDIIATDLTEFDASELSDIDGKKLLMKVEAGSGGVIDWVTLYADQLRNLLQKNGALLLRGLSIQGSKKLGRVLSSIFDKALLEYSYRSTPHTKMGGRIYTSSEYHPDETIFLHNENAYSNRWPMNIAFYCVKPADRGGATPIADSRRIYADVPIVIREEFERKKLLYVRNYGNLDLLGQKYSRLKIENWSRNIVAITILNLSGSVVTDCERNK